MKSSLGMRTRTWTWTWVVISVLAVLCTTAFAQNVAPASPPSSGSAGPGGGLVQQLMREELADGKKRLAKSLLSTDLRNRDSITVTPSFTWKLGSLKGSAASTFRSFNQSFVLAGKVLYRLTDNSGPNNFEMKPVAQFQEFLGEVAFVESVEWDGLLYLVAAYKQGLLQLFTVSPDNKVVLRQSVDCHGVPTDAEFFMQDEKLFLIVSAQNGSALVPVAVYRWYGTQLDEENRHLEIKATAVSTFPFQDSVIIAVAVGPTSNRQAGLVIFRRLGSKFDMVQFISISEPSALQHFSFRSENYLLVTSSGGASVICWWAGTEMVIWNTLQHKETIRSVGVGYVHGETLILLAESTRITIYRPTVAALQFVDSHEFNATVQSASLFTRDDSISLLAITESEGALVPYVLHLQLSFQPASPFRIFTRDPLLECISNLETNIKNRKSRLQDIQSQSRNLLLKSTPGKFTGRLVVKKLVQNNVDVRDFKLSPDGIPTAPDMSPVELQRQTEDSLRNVQSLKSELGNIVFKSSPSVLEGRLTATELRIVNATMDSVFIAVLNDRSFDPKNLLLHSKEQKLTGSVTVDSLSVENLSVGLLNNFKIEDLLRRSAGHQIITGVKRVNHVKANKIVINSQSPVNGFMLKHVVRSKSPSSVVTVRGSKTFAGLNLQQLAVGLLNNANFTNWVASLAPPVPMPVPVPTVPTTKDLRFNGDLKVRNLVVSGSINGVRINDLLSSLFLKGLDQSITGEVTYTNGLDIKNLEASRVNGVHTSSLLTRSTDQSITGQFSVNSLLAPDLYPGRLNGLKLSDDVAYINSKFAVSTPVVFESLRSHALILPPIASISGEPIDTSLLSQPKIVYEKKVVVKGSLKLTDVSLESARVSLNGKLLNFKDLKNSFWTVQSDQNIQGNLQASAGINVKSLKVDTINGHSLDSYVYVSTKVLQGTWHFPSATIIGNLNHLQNAVQLPVSPSELSSNVVKTSGNYTVYGSKIFLGGFATKHLLSEYIDSKKVSDLLDEKLSREENSAFEEVWVGGNLVINSDLHVGSVNGVQLCDRMSKALLTDQSGHIPSATISAVSASNIFVKTFNTVPFHVIAGGTKPRLRKITVKGDVHVPGFTNVMSVNNKSLAQDYINRIVDRTQSGVIRGKKTFASGLHVGGHFDSLDYDGLRLKNLFANMLSKTQDQTLSARIWMENMAAGELKAVTVNDVEINNLLTSDSLSRQTIEGNIIFSNDLEVGAHLSATFERGCDLKLVVQRLQNLNGRHWSSLSVQGSLHWERALPLPVPGLGYYLESAVTKNTVQPIAGEVSFANTISVDNFVSRKDINDVDITGILSDALKKSLPDQVIHGAKVFTNKLKSASMHVTGNVVAKRVGDVVIAAFNNSLVRVSGDQEVRGNKRFLQGFSADLLKIDGTGTINGLLTSDVVSYDMPLLPAIHFMGPLEVAGDLNFDRVNDFSLDELLRGRVTLDGLQQIEGHITFTRDLTVAGDMVAPRINNLDMSDIVERESLQEQVISGTKQFVRDLRVDGPMEVDNLEGVLLRAAYSSALFKDENATIYNNLVFGNLVNVESNLDVTYTVNDVEMARLGQLLRTVQPRSLAQVRSIARTINDTNFLLKARGDLSEMLYLEPVLGVPISFTNTHRAVAMDIGGGETYLDLYGWGSNSLCGIPANCPCPTQYSLHVDSEGLEHAAWKSGVQHNTSERSFTFHIENPRVALIVKTNTVSSSSRCRRVGVDLLDEVTLLTWVQFDERENGYEVSKETTLLVEPTPIYGYVSDVKVISVGNRVYVVLGIGYNADLDSTDINSVIVRVDTSTRKATIVHEFETHGVTSLDVFYTNSIPYLVVGNSYDSSRKSPQVHLDIYKFMALKEQLVLVKSIPAEGVISVSSVVQGGDNLIIVAQNQHYSPVMVLKYDPLHEDYHFMQQLNANTIPTGLGVFYIGQPGQSDAFLGVSTSDDQFFLYKFCHIEGFKLVMKMELPGVQGFSSFSRGHKQYLLFTSHGKPSVFEIVKQY